MKDDSNSQTVNQLLIRTECTTCILAPTPTKKTKIHTHTEQNQQQQNKEKKTLLNAVSELCVIRKKLICSLSLIYFISLF